MATSPLTDTPSPVLASAARKVMTRLLPVLVIAFIINYIDRVNVGFVASHLKTDLGIGAAAYGLGAGLFFVGYAIFEVPSNMLLHRFGAKVWITRIMVTWGIVAAAMAFTTNEAVFYILRFLLGVAEAGFFPGCVLYIATWLPGAYRGKAMAVLLTGSAVASIIAGPITGGLLMISGGGLRGWQWMFIIEGLAAVVLSAMTWFALVNSPEKARWLGDAERGALRDALNAEQAEREEAHGGKVSVWKLLADVQILLFCFIYFAIQLVIYAATFWLPTIIKQMGKMTDFEVGLWNTVPWVIAIVAMYVFAALAARRPMYQRWVACALVLAAIGMFVSTIGGPVVMYIGICVAALGFKSASSLFWPIPQSYFDIRIAAAGIALINSIGNLGGFVAPTVFGALQQSTGSVVGGLYGLAVSSLVAAVVVLGLRMRKRKITVGAPVSTDPIASH